MGNPAEEAVRICGLPPGATEVVAALGQADRLVGISHECDWPAAIRPKPVVVRPRFQSGRLPSRELDHRVSATVAAGHRLYELDEAAFLSGRPTVVLTQDLCDVCAVTPDQLGHALAALPSPPRLLHLHATRLGDVAHDVIRIGAGIGRLTEGLALAASLRAELRAVESQLAAQKEKADVRPRVACVEWLDPPYIAGHWVPDMVACAGGVDALGLPGSPSRRTTWGEIAEADPDILVLMPCGYTVAQTLTEMATLATPPEWNGLRAVREGRVFAVDASAHFSRPGPRLIRGVRVLAAICHPHLGEALPREDAAPASLGAVGKGPSRTSICS